MERYNELKGRLEKKTLYSAMVALQYFKGFSVIRTKNVNETAEFIIHFANKLERSRKSWAIIKSTICTKIKILTQLS